MHVYSLHCCPLAQLRTAAGLVLHGPLEAEEGFAVPPGHTLQSVHKAPKAGNRVGIEREWVNLEMTLYSHFPRAGQGSCSEVSAPPWKGRCGFADAGVR